MDIKHTIADEQYCSMVNCHEFCAIGYEWCVAHTEDVLDSIEGERRADIAKDES